MLVLVLNCGSSSLKFQLIETDLARIEKNSDSRIAHGQIERIGGAAIVTFTPDDKPPERSGAPIRNIQAAIETVIKWLSASSIISSLKDIQAIGHRVVHGGERFTTSVIITEDVIRGPEDCIELAPLHNPANIMGIRACAELFGASFSCPLIEPHVC